MVNLEHQSQTNPGPDSINLLKVEIRELRSKILSQDSEIKTLKDKILDKNQTIKSLEVRAESLELSVQFIKESVLSEVSIDSTKPDCSQSSTEVQKVFHKKLRERRILNLVVGNPLDQLSSEPLEL